MIDPHINFRCNDARYKFSPQPQSAIRAGLRVKLMSVMPSSGRGTRNDQKERAMGFTSRTWPPEHPLDFWRPLNLFAAGNYGALSGYKEDGAQEAVLGSLCPLVDLRAVQQRTSPEANGTLHATAYFRHRREARRGWLLGDMRLSGTMIEHLEMMQLIEATIPRHATRLTIIFLIRSPILPIDACARPK